MYNGYIAETVALELKQDCPSIDLTSLLIPANKISRAKIITRENMVFCGKPYVEEILNQIKDKYGYRHEEKYPIKIDWQIEEGSYAYAGETICHIYGISQILLTAERSILNFIQTLSSTASISREAYSWLPKNSKTIILDTRKTIPSLRYAQKYAVNIGGCGNHRLGLSDAFLIKENHIIALGGIDKAVNNAKSIRKDDKTWIEVEVESIPQLEEALLACPDRIMLDNFSFDNIKKSIDMRNQTNQEIKLEASGVKFDKEIIKNLALLGIDYISLGSLTKNIKAIDLSMRIIE